jgi:hypothetical protein
VADAPALLTHRAAEFRPEQGDGLRPIVGRYTQPPARLLERLRAEELEQPVSRSASTLTSKRSFSRTGGGERLLPLQVVAAPAHVLKLHGEKGDPGTDSHEKPGCGVVKRLPASR